MNIVEITRAHFAEWRILRHRLYGSLEGSFHDQEMELIHAAQDATCFLGLSESGEVVAFLELTLRNYVDGCLGGPVGYIEGIYLEPGMRGRGHGRRLVAHAAAWFRERGCRDMAADAELDNIDAQRFLSKAGFEETFRIVEFKQKL